LISFALRDKYNKSKTITSRHFIMNPEQTINIKGTGKSHHSFDITLQFKHQRTEFRRSQIQHREDGPVDYSHFTQVPARAPGSDLPALSGGFMEWKDI
jgi:hypothetical protein